MFRTNLSAGSLAILATLMLCQTGFSQSIFNRFDTNKDGKLTKDEIPAEARRLQQMLKDADQNQDGMLTEQEVAQYITEFGGPGGGVGQPPGFGGRGQRGGGRAGPDAQFGREAPKIGDPLPNLTAYDANGNEFKLSSLKGHYSVLVFGCLT